MQASPSPCRRMRPSNLRRGAPFGFVVASSIGAIASALVACGGDDSTPVHALGGSVSGLASNGLVLTDGATTVAVPSGATSFTFAGGLAEGASYTVTAQTQPASATCSVANGSGTVGSADVMNVQVTCAASAFSIGGTISGLTGSGLVIANGADQVSPASGATSFVFANRVASGASYSIAIAQQPSGQTCSVSGTYPATVGTSAVNVAVTCAAHATTSAAFVGNDASCNYADGSGASAGFAGTYGNGVFDAAGNLYVADKDAAVIRKITPQGVVSTLAGNPGVPGFSDGTGAAAAFNIPAGLAMDAAGRILVADSANAAIRIVTTAGVVTTLVGSPAQQSAHPSDGPGATATFYSPQGLAVDSAGYVYFTENGFWVRRVAPNAAHDVSLYAGSYGETGTADGTLATARFSNLVGMAFDSGGNLLLADHVNNNVRKIAPDGTVTTLAGSASGTRGYADGTGSAALFDNEQWLAVDAAGNAYVSDLQNWAIRKVTPAGVVTTVLHKVPPFVPLQSLPNGIEIDPQGNLDVQANCSIVKISP